MRVDILLKKGMQEEMRGERAGGDDHHTAED